MSLTIVQISDIHIGEEGTLTFEADGRDQFRKALEVSKGFEPDLIVISGDLCLDEPVESTYPWVKGLLEKVEIPYFVISGNHDDSMMLAQTFHQDQLKNRELFYQQRINGHFIVFVDSGRGRFSSDQWTWLEKEVLDKDEIIHIFMHHPPVYAGVPYLDNRHAFIEQERFVDLMNCVQRPVHVYCGHYHTARYVQHENLHIHICPSTLFQMNANKNDFEVASTTPGIQLIRLDQSRVETQIHWCE